MWHIFLTKKLVPHYINPNRSLVQLLHLMLTGTVAFSSSPWEEPHPCLARQWWVSSHGLDEIEDCSEACRLTYLEEELPLVFLITFLLLLLSVILATISTRTRMRRKRTLKMWYLTENGDNFDRFLNFHKKIINWWHFFTQKLVPFAIEFSRINKNFYKKITKIGDNLLIENVTKIGEK